MKKQLRVGFVGCGEATQALHTPALNSLASLYRIAACTDASAEVMAQVASRTGARPIERPLDLINDPDVDVVLIATPDMYHSDYALAACTAKKKAVLVEKPMTLNPRMAREIARASDETGVPVLVGYVHVYDPAVRRAAELWGETGFFNYGQFRCFLGPNEKYTADDILQTIRPAMADRWPGLINQLSLAAVSTELLGTGVEVKYVVGHALLRGLVIHDIPVMRRLLGEPVKVDYASIRAMGPPMSEVGMAIDVMFDYGQGRVLLQAEFEKMKVTDWGFQLRRDDLHLHVQYPPTFAAAAPSTCKAIYEKNGMTVEEIHGGRYETGFRCEWKHIYDVVTAGVAPIASAQDAVKDLELVDEIITVAVKSGN
ncbi:MAG: gfo/Idh/MocA family oxidoreductase [Candidatus Abyssobacteria bacterium SURF_17]|uniref:Gfo/Idh/MocA family oxidoreductase n=1 Tax=Candidatus Abyssobacteria bacterium SURF_17 TaxID=2093361 RepID=A0A419F4Y2_9BACT|nr:MAG: gfo/Idh/MocA family oxidoreductase [Candidatus Abyssubacteria bacterium SURF_17]